MAHVSSGTGRIGKTFNDRELAAEVRTLTLKEIKKVLQGKEGEFKQQVILRLAGSVLPRLNEVTGKDGEALPVPILNIHVPTNNGNQTHSGAVC